jgi:cytoskeletal protein CcmA (bactofilin family)
MADASNPPTPTIVAEGTLVKGEIHGAGDLELKGTIDGSCTVKGTLTVRPSGCMVGTVDAGTVVVEGEVKGNIEASRQIELRATCQVRGDISALSIAIADGSFFEGQITTRRGATKR